MANRSDRLDRKSLHARRILFLDALTRDVDNTLKERPFNAFEAQIHQSKNELASVFDELDEIVSEAEKTRDRSPDMYTSSGQHLKFLERNETAKRKLFKAYQELDGLISLGSCNSQQQQR